MSKADSIHLDSQVTMSYKPPSDFQPSKGTHLEDDQQNLELFLIQVPKTFNIEKLNGKEYIPGQIIDVATDETLPGQLSAVYQLAATAMQDLDLKPLVKHKKETVVGQPISGHLSVTKCYRVETKPSAYTLPNLERPGPSAVRMPEGLKQRFTPFGSSSPFSSRKHSKRHKHLTESTTLSDEMSPKKKKKKRDKNKSISESPVSTNECSPPSHLLEENDSQSRLRAPDETLPEKQEDQFSPSQGKHKKKKQKRHKVKKDKDGEADSVMENGTLDLSNSLAGEEIKGILSSSCKVKKQKKNVSFSMEDSFAMNSSGDAGKFNSWSGVKETLFDKEEHKHNLNGSSKKLETVETGKKRKHSSGYSSAGMSSELDSPSSDNTERPAKKKKKKHKVMHTDSH